MHNQDNEVRFFAEDVACDVNHVINQGKKIYYDRIMPKIIVGSYQRNTARSQDI